ncbi:hypothetical protein [Rhodocaloribacter sp.]
MNTTLERLATELNVPIEPTSDARRDSLRTTLLRLGIAAGTFVLGAISTPLLIGWVLDPSAPSPPAWALAGFALYGIVCIGSPFTAVIQSLFWREDVRGFLRRPPSSGQLAAWIKRKRRVMLLTPLWVSLVIVTATVLVYPLALKVFEPETLRPILTIIAGWGILGTTLAGLAFAHKLQRAQQ